MALADVDTTLFNALLGLKADPQTSGKPFAAVMRTTEPLTRQNVETWADLHWPCAFLFWQSSASDVDAETLTGDRETRERGRWVIYVGVEDKAGDDALIQGLNSVPGALALKGVVAAACNGLMVAAPAATLQFGLTGTPGATVTFGDRTLVIGNVSFQPLVASATLDGAGHAAINAQCVTPGALGNQPPKVNATWSGGISGLSSTAVVQSTVTQGRYGTLSDAPVGLVGSQPGPSMRGAFYTVALTFEVITRAEQWAVLDESRTLTAVNANLNAVGDTAMPPQTVILVPSGWSAPGGPFGSSVTIDGNVCQGLSAATLADDCANLAAAINATVPALVTATASATRIVCVSLVDSVTYSIPNWVTVTPVVPSTAPVLLDQIHVDPTV